MRLIVRGEFQDQSVNHIAQPHSRVGLRFQFIKIWFFVMQQRHQQKQRVSSNVRLLIVVAIAAISGLYVTSILKKETATKYVGYLAAETSVVVADRQGKIKELHVTQGDEVEPQKLVATLIDLEQSQQVKAIQAALKQNIAKIEQAEAAIDIELTWRTRAIETDLHRTQLESAGFLKKQLDLKMEVLALNKLSSQKPSNNVIAQSAFIPISQSKPKTEQQQLESFLKLEANRNATEVVETQLAICEERIERLNDIAKTLPEKVKRIHQLQTLKNEQQQLKKQLAVTEEKQATIKLHTSTYGTIGIVHRNVGDKVQAGEPIAMLLDQQQRYLVVHVPSTEIDKFTSAKTAEAKVLLTFAGGITRSGLIHSIPPQAEKMQDGTATPSVQVVKVRVIPYGKPWLSVPIGSQVDVRLQE